MAASPLRVSIAYAMSSVRKSDIITPASSTAEDIFVKLLADAELQVTLAARGTIDVKL